MGVIAKDGNQITLYYNSETSLGKQTYPYVKSAEKDILAVDISKTTVTGTQWAELADNLKIPIKDLVDQDHPNFVEVYGKDKVDLDENDWFRVLEKTPSVLTCAIVVDGKKTIPIKSPSDFVKYIEDDSAGLEETPKL
ncbi:Arsenate reductase, glutaredoxin family [Pricia antarctica]|uniref:Arsenate reductase, glutaredoxin family n=1 Tax=Pricia antarctica TaxID=641691 RepID=A0A1G7GBI5_9FLAO|nr:hypothetical protein [Pricia antarctica]SDE85471.1 Arsenate reductase, glutaredoxin family [Pricia antarctica]